MKQIMSLTALAIICVTAPAYLSNMSHDLLRLICSDDLDVRRKWFADYEKSRNLRKENCSELLKIIYGDASPNALYFTPKNIALYVLSDIVDYSADTKIINALISFVDIKFSGQEVAREFEDIDKAYPAIRGLLRIGQPATKAVLDKIKSTSEEGLLYRFAFWFSRHYGKGIAVHLLTDHIKEIKGMSQIERERLEQVIKIVKSDPW